MEMKAHSSFNPHFPFPPSPLPRVFSPSSSQAMEPSKPRVSFTPTGCLSPPSLLRLSTLNLPPLERLTMSHVHLTPVSNLRSYLTAYKVAVKGHRRPRTRPDANRFFSVLIARVSEPKKGEKVYLPVARGEWKRKRQGRKWDVWKGGWGLWGIHVLLTAYGNEREGKEIDDIEGMWKGVQFLMDKENGKGAEEGLTQVGEKIDRGLREQEKRSNAKGKKEHSVMEVIALTSAITNGGYMGQ